MADDKGYLYRVLRPCTTPGGKRREKGFEFIHPTKFDPCPRAFVLVDKAAQVKRRRQIMAQLILEEEEELGNRVDAQLQEENEADATAAKDVEAAKAQADARTQKKADAVAKGKATKATNRAAAEAEARESSTDEL